MSEQEAEEETREYLNSWNSLESMLKVVEGYAPSADEKTKLAIASAMRQSASPETSNDSRE